MLGRNVHTLIRVNFVIAVLINLLILTQLTSASATDTPFFPADGKWAELTVGVLGGFQLGLSGLVLAFDVVKRGPLIFKEQLRHMNRRSFHLTEGNSSLGDLLDSVQHAGWLLFKEFIYEVVFPVNK